MEYALWRYLLLKTYLKDSLSLLKYKNRAHHHETAQTIHKVQKLKFWLFLQKRTLGTHSYIKLTHFRIAHLHSKIFSPRIRVHDIPQCESETSPPSQQYQVGRKCTCRTKWSQRRERAPVKVALASATFIVSSSRSILSTPTWASRSLPTTVVS